MAPSMIMRAAASVIEGDASFKGGEGVGAAELPRARETVHVRSKGRNGG
jgi:hypothetical protein